MRAIPTLHGLVKPPRQTSSEVPFGTLLLAWPVGPSDGDRGAAGTLVALNPSPSEIFNAEVLFREDCSPDEFIDVIVGNRVYMPCLYVSGAAPRVHVQEGGPRWEAGVPEEREGPGLAPPTPVLGLREARKLFSLAPGLQSSLPFWAWTAAPGPHSLSPSSRQQGGEDTHWPPCPRAAAACRARNCGPSRGIRGPFPALLCSFPSATPTSLVSIPGV